MRPMLALKCPRHMTMDVFISKLQYPLLATPKIDGIRCVTHPPDPYPDWISSPLTRSLKHVPNNHVREQIATLVPPWVDGELTCGDNFQAVTSGIMTHMGIPDFTYYVFDCTIDQGHIDRIGYSSNTYEDRVDNLKTLSLPSFCKKLIPVQLDSLEDLLQYEKMCLDSGAEGVMVRPPHSPPYQGRSSFRNPWLIAIKRFTDAEASVEIIYEKMHNGNESELNALGYRERTTHKAGMVGMNTMGSLGCVDLETKAEFAVGTGFTEDQRQEIWNTWPAWRGKIIKYRYQDHGVLNAPRIPSFMGLRASEDMSIRDIDMTPRPSGQLRMSI